MTREHVLSSEQSKALRRRHPLYTRLSGDTVWGLLEETGLDADACGTAMDAFLADMREVLLVMDRLERGEAGYLAFRLKGPVCAQCGLLAGKAVTTADSHWRSCLPPFAVGCSVGCLALNQADLAREPRSVVPVADLTLPRRALLCALRYPQED